jgi:outer membrane immunogenic protein
MELKYSIKRAVVVLSVLALVSITAVAQENRSEISIQGTGFFTKDTVGNGIFQDGSETGGFLVGYRYNFNRWLAAQADYGYGRNTQFYFGGTAARVQSGALVFDPTGNSGGGFAGATLETKAAFVYGVGADYAFSRHFSLRAEYRGLVYKAPSFNVASLNTGSWTQIAQPSAGIVFRF